MLSHQFIKLRIYLKKFVVILAIDFGTGAVIDRNNRCRSLAAIEHTDFSKMRSSIKLSNLSFFKSISKFVSNLDFAFAFSNKIQIVIFWCDWVVLLAKYKLRRIEHCLHALDYITDDILIVTLSDINLLMKQIHSDRISLNCRLEDLNWTKNAISLRNSSFHEFIQFILQSRSWVCCDKVLIDLSSQLWR